MVMMAKHKMAWLARLLVLAVFVAGFQPAFACPPTTSHAPHAVTGVTGMAHDIADHDHADMVVFGDVATATDGHLLPPKCQGKALACCPAMMATLIDPAAGLDSLDGPRLIAASSHALEDHPVAPLPDPPRNRAV